MNEIDMIRYGMAALDSLSVLTLLALAALWRKVDAIEAQLKQHASKADIEYAHRRMDGLSKLVKPILARKR